MKTRTPPFYTALFQPDHYGAGFSSGALPLYIPRLSIFLLTIHNLHVDKAAELPDHRIDRKAKPINPFIFRVVSRADGFEKHGSLARLGTSQCY